MLSEGSLITFSGYSGSFYIASAVLKNHVLSVTAYDRCKNLDIPFDYSGYEQFDADGNAKWYASSGIVSNIAHQCGFSSGGYSPARMPQLCYNDIAGRSCRQILTDLSQVNVGFWYANGTALSFRAFDPSGSSIEISEDNRSEISISGTKVISGIYAEDDIYGTEYSSGAGWDHTERLHGRYLTADIAALIAGQILSDGGSYEYTGWDCEALLSIMPDIGDGVAYGGKKLPVLSLVYTFDTRGVVGRLSAPAADVSFSEYHDLYARRIEGKLSLDRSYGLFYASENSFGLRVDL